MRVESVDPISDSETVPFQNVDYLFDISKSSNLLAELNRLLCTEELIILPVDLRKADHIRFLGRSFDCVCDNERFLQLRDFLSDGRINLNRSNQRPFWSLPLSETLESFSKVPNMFGTRTQTKTRKALTCVYIAVCFHRCVRIVRAWRRLSKHARSCTTILRVLIQVQKFFDSSTSQQAMAFDR